MEVVAPKDSGSWWERVQAQIGREYPRVRAWDSVNEPMIRQWCEALGDELPLYTAGMAGRVRPVAPPAMLRAWLLPGFAGKRPSGGAQADATAVRQLFADGGYSGLIGVESDEELLRDLCPGDRLSYASVLESVSELKRTRLGEGFFFVICMTVFDQRDEAVARIRSRELAYRPISASARA